MALQLKKTSSFNVGVIVAQSIGAIQKIRAQESSKKESAFQMAVAEGLPYDAQIAFREKQLEALKKESFLDNDYIEKVNESITSTKRLERFHTYRTKYAEALTELNAGHLNAIDYADKLKKLLGGADDPDLQLEIQGNISQAETAVTTYKRTILENQVKIAKYDGTEKIIRSTMNKVKAARATASINDNEDEMAEHDATLASLNSQLAQVKAEDIVNKLTVSGAFSDFSSTEKLNTLNNQIDGANTNTSIILNGKRYNSEREYWEITRNSYLNGSGTGIFTDYFGEVENQYQKKIEGSVAKFGYVPTNTIDGINSDFNRMKSKPELAPFIEKFESLQSVTVGKAVDTMARTILDRSTYTGEFKKADTALKNLSSQYGVDTSLQQLELGNRLNQQVNASIEAGQGIPEDAYLLGAEEFPIPSTVPTPVVTPGAPAKPGASKSYKVVAGDSLSKIAAQNKVSLTQLLESNPEYRANPNLVKVGATIKLPGAPAPVAPAPVVPVAPVKTPKATAPVPVAKASTVPVVTPGKPSSPSKKEESAKPTAAQEKQVADAAKAVATLVTTAKKNGTYKEPEPVKKTSTTPKDSPVTVKKGKVTRK